VARIWEEDDSMLSTDKLTRKAEPFIFYSGSPGTGRCMWRELETGPKMRPKVNGGLTTGAC
jgi:hypothetical protein